MKKPSRWRIGALLCLIRAGWHHILDAYRKYGFYVFTGVLGNDELRDIEADLEAMKQRFPKGPGETLAADGSPGLGTDCSALTLLWSKPLGDPLGGTELANGRHQVKLREPEAAADAPDWTAFILWGRCSFQRPASEYMATRSYCG